MSQGLPRKLRYAFILQMVLAGASVIVGALVAGSIVKGVLTDQQLRSEAGQFWSGRARDADYPLPRSSTMHGYFTTGQQPAAGVPDELRRFGVGISELPGGNRKLIIDERPRSEEHTSELQSLMRISYAVFCLKKKTTSITTHSTYIDHGHQK